MRAGWWVGGACGLILLISAIGAWWFPPLLTAVLVGVAVVVMSVWQWQRRRRGIAPVSENSWVTVGVPTLFGGLAVITLNGWIMQVSRKATGGESGVTAMLVGFVTGVIFMASAYGYGRLRAQRVQVSEQQYGGRRVRDTGDEHDAEDELDPNEWLRNFNRDEL
ncbi:hypothetical protein GOHSU_45_00370 [Gordonia hirsuta DSM 44140 = NBRC 16056]|uniref:Transmembrane protein n=1 Tax=Gordonia hirsuta DSM 44140 = NBRC 16056 TaxID=1121927 RepID=L7LD39_9ACTN|nr:hypothetical protein [Gordonia hirsuta]GAC58671.1 hypothetical protein GOHSU_45_00370 [Gordonia hirsuta DSM 44140 = NBRC 16056]